jgi:hypothetical protein
VEGKQRCCEKKKRERQINTLLTQRSHEMSSQFPHNGTQYTKPLRKKKRGNEVIRLVAASSRAPFSFEAIFFLFFGFKGMTVVVIKTAITQRL